MISQVLGIHSDYVIIGLAVLTVILLILYIVNIVQMAQLKKRYRIFMSGKNARNLEKTLIERLDQVDALLEANATNEKNIKTLVANTMIPYCEAFYSAFLLRSLRSVLFVLAFLGSWQRADEGHREEAE